MKKNTYIVTVSFSTVELRVSAKNKTEAKKKALEKLSKKNPVKFIHRLWPGNRKDIGVDII